MLHENDQGLFHVGAVGPVLGGLRDPAAHGHKVRIRWSRRDSFHVDPGSQECPVQVRAGDWKLLEYHEDSQVELFNLADDLGEGHDLAATQRERAQQLREKLHAWRKSVDAQMPEPNPQRRR